MAARKTKRSRETQLTFEAISIEGGLLSPEWLSKVAQLAASSQNEADYRIPKGLNLRDEIGRYWRIAQAHWKEFAGGLASKADPKELSNRFVVSLLKEAFDFKSLESVEPIVLSERRYPLGYAGLNGRVPVIIAPANSGVDTLSPLFADEGRRRSAFGLAQEFLNAADGALWGIATDGSTLRIVRDNASLTRPAWLEADLARIFTEERYADFAALWLLLHESRFGREGQPANESALETWRNAGREEGTRAREHLRKGVEEALAALGQGFLGHPENQALRAAFQDGSLTTRDYFSQLLRLVYRLIFLLTVEERNLLHPPETPDAVRKLYSDGYSLRRLAEKSVKRSAHDRFSDLWESIKVVLRGLACSEPRLGLPALAGIFAKSQCPALDAARLENRALLLAMFKLAWLREDGALARVNWRDMGPEELGSVYESLLELVPQISNGGRQFGFASGDETKGNARKTSGSYYTPDSLVQVLLDSALEPVIADTIARNPANPIDALLGLSIVDPACGSGHFLLAAARRLAAHVARLQANGTPSAAEYRHALRQVVGKCIYGVDLNPMAVELCKVSLWMEAVEPGLPLTFLNSHIQQGNALLGTSPELMEKGIPEAAWEAIEGDDPATSRALKRRNREGATGQRSFDTFWTPASASEAQVITKAVTELEAASDADSTALARKEFRWENILTSVEYRHQKFVADLWCSAFVWPKQPGELSEAAPVNELWRELRDGRGQPSKLTTKTAEDLAEKYNFFHWHLQFPQVFARGGFDILVGNPPWERTSFEEIPFFSSRSPEIAKAPTTAARRVLIEALKHADPVLFEEYQASRRKSEGESHFVSGSGRYPRTSVSRIDTYALFAEAATGLVAGHGLVGILVPTGIATATPLKDFWEWIFVKGRRVKSLFDFENRQGYFDKVDSRKKFCLLTICGTSRSYPKTFFAFFLPGASSGAISQYAFAISPEEMLLINPDGGQPPIVRSPRDLKVLVGIFESSVGPNRDNPGWVGYTSASTGASWRSFRELEKGNTADMTDLIEGKMINQFDHWFATYERCSIEAVEAGSPERVEKQKTNPNFRVQPRFLVPTRPSEGFRASKTPNIAYLGVYRDYTSATNERTLIAAIVADAVPMQPLNGFTFRSARDAARCLGQLNSFVIDFAARQLTPDIHLNVTIFNSLPGQPKQMACAGWLESSPVEFVVRRVLELTYTAWDFEPFARDVGFKGPPFRWDLDRRFFLRCELDAAFFHLYGISREDTDYIMDTFPIVRKNDEKAHGEYRTKRVILEIYDEMAEAIRTGKPYQTRLDPAPADPSCCHPPKAGASVCNAARSLNI